VKQLAVIVAGYQLRVTFPWLVALRPTTNAQDQGRKHSTPNNKQRTMFNEEMAQTHAHTNWQHATGNP
jgi:hypothetical protein